MSERINSDVPFDVISDILETLRFRGSIFFHSELAAPWGISFASIGLPRFHIALAGDFVVSADDKNIVDIRQMDIAMLASGETHWIADQVGRRLIPSERGCDLSQAMFQQGPISHRLMCGIVHFDQEAKHPIFDLLPAILHFPQFAATDPVWMLVALIDAELSQVQESRGGIIDRLTEALFLKLVHRYISDNQELSGFLAGLGDRRVHQALMLIHQQPNEDWSLHLLGERVGMSRATLTRRFQETIGIAPMAYISQWRLTKAYNLLKYSDTDLEKIAESVGFVSARTLSRAFQTHYGYTPTQLRKNLSSLK